MYSILDALNACERIKAGMPEPGDEYKCAWVTNLFRLWMEARILRMLMSMFRIPIRPIPDPSPEELTAIPDLRNILIDDFLANSLVSESLGPGLLYSIRESGIYTDVLRGFVDRLDTVNKNLRTELSALERLTGQGK